MLSGTIPYLTARLADASKLSLTQSALLGEYKRFEDLAEKTLTRLKQEDFTSFYEKVEREKSFIHGDCQYHNMLLEKDKMAVINFEKCLLPFSLYFIKKHHLH